MRPPVFELRVFALRLWFEFVFAASDLIEAGWDIRSWIMHGTTMTHPFGQYRATYPPALQQLKALISAAN